MCPPLSGAAGCFLSPVKFFAKIFSSREISAPESMLVRRGGKEVTKLEDRQIINLFYERSEQAIEELDRKYGAAVRKTAANILRRTQDVEECTNDTYLGVWNTIPPQNPNSLISYVCRIARNLASLSGNESKCF